MGGRFKRFHAVAGPDDGHGGTVVFRVLLDRSIAFDSGLMRGQRDQKKVVDLDVAGVDELRLIVTDGGKGGDHADWADACVK